MTGYRVEIWAQPETDERPWETPVDGRGFQWVPISVPTTHGRKQHFRTEQEAIDEAKLIRDVQPRLDLRIVTTEGLVVHTTRP